MKNLKFINNINIFNILCSLILIFTIFLLISFFIRPKTYATKAIEVKNLKGLILDNNTTIVQKFKADNNYTAMGFLASNNGNYINNGYINIVLKSNQKIIKKDTIPANEICDDSYYYKYYYIKYKFKKNKYYTIEITAKKLSDNVLLGTTNYKSNDLSLLKDEILQKRNLAIGFAYKTDNKFYFWYYLMIITLLITSIIILKMKGLNYEKNK